MDSTIWRRLLLACAIATALPLWLTGHLPFTDLPQHAAAIGTLRHWWDPVWRSRESFTLALGQTQYLLYYLVGAGLAFPFGTAERANLVLLSLVAVAYPYSLRALLRALGRDQRLALFACPLFWSQALLIGFFNYVAAMPLTLWGLSLAVRLAEERRRRLLVELAVASVALFYLHLSAFLFFAPCAVLASIALPQPHPPREWPRQLVWVLPTLLLSLLWLLFSPVAHPRSVGWEQPMAVAFEAPAVALRNLPDALLDIWRGPQDEWCLFALVAAAALLAWPSATKPPGDSWRRGLVAVWLAWAALLYFAFPVSIGWMWQLNERYALLFVLIAPALLTVPRARHGVFALGLLAATSIFAAATAWVQFRGFDREVGRFDEVLAHAEPGKRTIGMIFEQNSRFAKFSAFLHFQAYYRARKGGVASFSFAELPQSPLRYRPETAPPPHPPGWEWHANSFRNDVDGVYYDYVLVHAAFEPQQLHAPGPRWKLLARADNWQLYGKE